MPRPSSYTLRRSARARAARLTLRPDGEVVVTLPLRASERWAERLVAERSAWIERHRARLTAESARLAARPALGQGRPISFGGVAHEVYVSPVAGVSRTHVVHLDEDVPGVASAAPAVLRLVLAPGDERPPALILERWLRSQARMALERRIAIRSRDLGVEPGRLSVRDQRSRWGSASRRGTVSFSWRLILAPASVLDYVVVHELAHLRYFGHGPRFWALVRRHVPDADVHRRWLRAHDVDLRHALD